MNFRLVSLERWPDSIGGSSVLSHKQLYWFEAPNHAAAAKQIAVDGGKGLCEIEDSDGVRSKWRLHRATIHYAYPVRE